MKPPRWKAAPPPLDPQAFAEVVGLYADEIAAAVAERYDDDHDTADILAKAALDYAEALADVARYCVGALDEMSRGHFDAEGLAGDVDYFAMNDLHTAAQSALFTFAHSTNPPD